MNLSDYLHQNGITHEKFARQLGLASARSTQRYATGERMPRPKIMEKIRAITGGTVTAADFYGGDSKARASP